MGSSLLSLTDRDGSDFETSVHQGTALGSDLKDSFTKARNEFASIGVEGATLMVDGVKIVFLQPYRGCLSYGIIPSCRTGPLP